MKDPHKWYTLADKFPNPGDIIIVELPMKKMQVEVVGDRIHKWAYERYEDVGCVADILQWRGCNGLDF